MGPANCTGYSIFFCYLKMCLWIPVGVGKEEASPDLESPRGFIFFALLMESYLSVPGFVFPGRLFNASIRCNRAREGKADWVFWGPAAWALGTAGLADSDWASPVLSFSLCNKQSGYVSQLSHGVHSNIISTSWWPGIPQLLKRVKGDRKEQHWRGSTLLERFYPMGN